MAAFQKYSIITLSWLLFIICLYYNIKNTEGSLETCQANCVDAERLVGPTKMQYTRQHPWKMAEFPTKYTAFCNMGCQMFFSEVPNNITCKRSCDFAYRYQVTAGYSDVAEEAILECRDGCDIGLLVCQSGFFCAKGNMIECPPGTYREDVTSFSEIALQAASKCTDCPYGRYRPEPKGKSAKECSLCPIGKYANVQGSVLVSDCQRCSAGKTAEQEGMQLCKCITLDSCDMWEKGQVFGQPVTHWFQNNVDYFRETLPYIGRS